jgi:hypothetical protein
MMTHQYQLEIKMCYTISRKCCLLRLAVCTKGFVISGAGTANLSGAPKFTPGV